MELLLHRDRSHNKVTVTDWHDSLDRWFELDGTFIIDDFMREILNMRLQYNEMEKKKKSPNQ